MNLFRIQSLRGAMVVAAAGLFILAGRSLAQISAAETAASFAPLDQWKRAIIAGDAATLKLMYSSDPAARIETHGAVTTADDDVSFWLALKPSSIKVEIVRLKQKPDAANVIFKAEVQPAQSHAKSLNVTDAQAWRKQGEQWRIVAAERTDAPHLAQPSDMKKNLYPSDADAHAEIKEAEERASADHKRVLLVFGANWCYDCHVLDLAFHQPDFAAVMANYEVVHVDIGDDGKKNADIARDFQTPLDKGVPAMAIVESDGKLVVSQKNGEFEDARSLTPEALLEFLNRWKPQSR